jgi:hypothetical protein
LTFFVDDDANTVDGDAETPNDEASRSVLPIVVIVPLTKIRTAPIVDAINPATGPLPVAFLGRHPPIQANVARMTLQDAEKMQ